MASQARVMDMCGSLMILLDSPAQSTARWYKTPSLPFKKLAGR